MPRHLDLSLEEHDRSEKLVSILTGVLRNRPLKILRSVEDGNGLDGWRALAQQMAFDLPLAGVPEPPGLWKRSIHSGASSWIGEISRGVQDCEWKSAFGRHATVHAAEGGSSSVAKPFATLDGRGC